MKNVFDIDDKLLAQNPVNIAWVNLSEEISKFLPVNSISINVIEYSCKVHLYEKKLNGIGWIRLPVILVSLNI